MRIFTSLHILLFAYIMAALLFWGFSLEKQSKTIYEQQRIILSADIDSVKMPALYNQKQHELLVKKQMRAKQYFGEGTTFLIVIIIGAFIVYSSFRRRLSLSRQQNNFILSVTHELKSPIASMKLNLQTMEKHKLDEDKQRSLIERSLSEANRLNDLCNNLLLASQFDGNSYKPVIEQFDFSEMVEDTVARYAGRYPQRFEEDIETGCKLRGDRTMLEMAVNNLLENAVKYTPVNKPISIKLSCKMNAVILDIADEGPGIDAEEKKKVFNKFYRIGNENTRKSKGTGLGLYLVHRIITQHRGRITIKDNKPNGAIFEIILPFN